MLRRLLAKFPPLPGPVCDLGCGAGANLGVLAELPQTSFVLGLDASPEAAALCRRKGFSVLTGTHQDLARHGPFALVAALDVLEHIQDDREAVRAVWDALMPGGLFVVSVPAYPRLYSYHDRALGHHRRYTAGALEELLDGNGFEVKLLAHYNLAGLAAVPVRGINAALRREESDTALLARTPRWLDLALYRWCRLENTAAVKYGLPAGLSLVAMAVRH